jgi:hypothetical protein
MELLEAAVALADLVEHDYGDSRRNGDDEIEDKKQGWPGIA